MDTLTKHRHKRKKKNRTMERKKRIETTFGTVHVVQVWELRQKTAINR